MWWLNLPLWLSQEERRTRLSYALIPETNLLAGLGFCTFLSSSLEVSSFTLVPANAPLPREPFLRSSTHHASKAQGAPKGDAQCKTF